MGFCAELRPGGWYWGPLPQIQFFLEAHSRVLNLEVVGVGAEVADGEDGMLAAFHVAMLGEACEQVHGLLRVVWRSH